MHTSFLRTVLAWNKSDRERKERERERLSGDFWRGVWSRGTIADISMEKRKPGREGQREGGREGGAAACTQSSAYDLAASLARRTGEQE